jgi:uncharacterized protein (UPF0332 family)
MIDPKSESIRIKLTKARELLTDVNILVENGGYNSVISRLYYACYHATVALLLTKDIQSKTHKGVMILLHKEFVLKNEFDLEKSAFFNRLLQERIEEDYGDFLVVDESEILEFVEPAKEYIDYIERLINL